MWQVCKETNAKVCIFVVRHHFEEEYELLFRRAECKYLREFASVQEL